MGLTGEDQQLISAQIDRLDARIERLETAVPAEFHKLPDPDELRLRSRAAMLHVLNLEQESRAVWENWNALVLSRLSRRAVQP